MKEKCICSAVKELVYDTYIMFLESLTNISGKESARGVGSALF